MIVDQGYNVAEVGRTLRKAIPFVVSKDYNPGTSSERTLKAQMEDIVAAMELAAESASK